MTRQRIITAARQVFEERGYGQASIGDIAKAAKVNRATFYLHFTNKAEVFTEVYRAVREDQSAQYWSLLGRALAEGKAASVRAWLDGALSWWESQAALLPAIHEAMASDLEVAARWKDQIDQLVEAAWRSTWSSSRRLGARSGGCGSNCSWCSSTRCVSARSCRRCSRSSGRSCSMW